MLYSEDNTGSGIGNGEKSMVSAEGKEVCRMTKKVCNVLVALVDLMTPVTAGSCRQLFYEEKEPEGLQEFAAKKSKQEK